MGGAGRASSGNSGLAGSPATVRRQLAEQIEAAGVKTVIAITEGIPVYDMLRAYWQAKEAGVRLIGPNCPGVITPDDRPA